MSFKFKTSLSLLFVVAFSINLVAQTNSKFVWGINGHPLTQVDYNKATWSKQISYLKDLNLNAYRFDANIDVSGQLRNEASFNDLLSLLKSNNITPFPVMLITGLKNANTADIYNQCFNSGKVFGAKYNGKLSVIEVGNEEDNKTIKPGHDGDKADDFDQDKVSREIPKLKGFIDGVKSVAPGIKVSLSLGWVHYYYLDILKQNNVNYDIIGYHWYSNMGGGDITNVRAPFGNVLQKVKSRYNKEIWITEYNYWQGTHNSDYTKQDDYVNKNLKIILSQNLISGFFIYELFDEPALKQRAATESNYGLLDTDNGYVKKDAYSSYKSIVGSHAGN